MNRPVAKLALFAFFTSLPGGGDLYSQCSQTRTRTWTESSFECPSGQGAGDYNPACYDLVYGSSYPNYTEIWDFTESTKFCFTGDCSPGQMSSTLEQNLRFAGTIYCDEKTLIPIPYADPEICETGCDIGPDNGGSASLWFKMRVSSPVGGEDAHFLWIHQKQVDRRLYTPGALFLPNEKGLKIYRNPDYSIRQVLSPTYLANVHVTSPSSYEVAIHALSPGEELARDAEGYLAPPGKPLRTYRFSNPEPESLSAFRIETLAGPSRQTREFRWDETQGAWSFSNNAEATRQTASLEHYDKEKSLFTKTARTTDLATGLHRDTVRVFRDFPFGRRLISTEKRLAGKSLSTDVYTYGEDPDQPGSYTRLLSRQLYDGSWERFEYDQRGRLVKKLSSWKDSPFDSPENAVRVEAYGYLLVDPASTHYHPTAQFARIDEVIAGVKVATTFRLSTRDPIDGSNLRIEERAATAGAHFGAAGNARTTSRYYPEREADPASGQLRSTESPDGSVVSYRYESGDYEGEEGIGQFTARVGGAYTRTIRIDGTLAHPDGVPGRSLASLSVESPRGTTLLEESRLVQEGDPAGGALLSWSGHAYDDNGHRILSRDSTGIIAEYRHNSCCNEVEWQRDRNGVETFYTRDADKRVIARIVKAPGRPEVETHYDYGHFGQVIKETVVAGDLVQETKHEYDDEGERIATTTPDGLVTRFEHDHANRTHTTILPGGATQVETRYLDGQVKARTGTAIVAQHYDYGVQPDTGHRWTRVDTAKTDGPRWNRSTVDALGRSIRQETPGHGEGVVLAAHTAYDDRGRVVATQAGWVRPSVGADDEKGSAFHPLGPISLQTYDPETGEPLLSGQDLDGDNQLTPGKDRLTKSESRFEEIAGAWWEVSRQWTYPLQSQGQPLLISEQRRRLTGLGQPHPRDPGLGLLVSESVTIQPPAAENAAGNNENLVSRSLAYRHRETGLVTTLSADPRGLVTVQTSQGGVVTSVSTHHSDTPALHYSVGFDHDALGRRISVRDPRTGESKTVYDPKTGRPLAEIDPENRATRYAYYPAEHPAAGRLATVVNADGKEQHLAYTTRGEQRAVWGDSVQPLLYDYNEYGERVGMRTFQTTPEGDPSHVEDTGAKTAWHFHEATGSLLRKEYADGKGPEYAYNEAGQLKERRWARESSPQRGTEAEGSAGAPARTDERLATLYEYDPATLQLAKSTATDGTEVQYEYDPDGRVAKVTDATGTREFAYDLRGQVVKETVVLQHDPAGDPAKADPIRYEIRRSYTALGQPESVHLVSADGQSVALDHQIGYSWNAHNQLASVKSLAGDFAYAYDEANPALLTKMTGPVHEAETSYEPHRNLVTGVVNRVLTQSAARRTDEDTKGKVVSSYTYSNDLLGRRETISQGGEAFGMLALGANQVEVAYNDRSEVTGAVYRSGGEARQTFDYAYDAIGNRREAASSRVTGQESREEKVSYEANAINQYAAIDEQGSSNPKSEIENPKFDPDGNLLEDARNTYTWNADNNLIRVDAKDGSLRLDYIYDYQSRRTVRIETKQPGTENEAQKTTYYLYDAWNLMADVSAVTGHRSGVTGKEADAVRYYTWGRDLSGSRQGAGGVGGLLAISKVHPNPDEDKPGEAQLQTLNLKLETLFPTYDANGNIGQLIDERGRTVAAYSYDPFGNVTEMAGAEASGNPWRFSTKPVEAGTGWLYYGFRYYDPTTGRWASRDPIEEEGGLNLYAFVENMPTNAIDVLGFGQLSDLLEQRMLYFYNNHSNQVGSRHPNPPPGCTKTDCITYCYQVIEWAYQQMGQKSIADQVYKKRTKGTDLAAYLQSIGWKAVYWNPDVKNPSDGDNEHPFSYTKAKGQGTYYTIPVAGFVINYRPTVIMTSPGWLSSLFGAKPKPDTKTMTPKDVSGLTKLNKVKFGYGLARGGMHTFLYGSGSIYEVHWEGLGTTPNGPNGLYEKSPFESYGWLSGLVLLPPDNGEY